MKKGFIALVLGLAIAISLANSSAVTAKTIKKIPDGGYLVEFKTCKIKNRTLIVKGKVINWVRSVNTPEYSKKGTFKFKLTKKCELLDGYRETEKTISIKKFNRLCRKHDDLHGCIVFMVENNKTSLIRFW